MRTEVGNVSEVFVSAEGSQTVQNGISAAQLNILGPISDLVPGSNPALDKFGQGNIILSGANSYGGNAGVRSFFWNRMTNDGVFYLNSSVAIKDITDGTSSTFLFGERSHRDVWFDKTYPSTLIENYTGWAWANKYGGYDYLFGAARPIKGDGIVPFCGECLMPMARTIASSANTPNGRTKRFIQPPPPRYPGL